MKVAPVAKKAKPLHQKLLKHKAPKAGAAGTKKRKETLLKGFAETSLSSQAVGPKARHGLLKDASSQEFSKKSSPQKSVSPFGAKSPKPTRMSKIFEKSSTPQRKSLQATSPPVNKASLKENEPTPAKHSGAESAKAIRSKRKSSIMPASNVGQMTLSDQASKTPVKRKSLAVLTSGSQIASPITKLANKSKRGALTPALDSVKSSKMTPKIRLSVGVSALSDNVQPDSTPSKKLLSKKKLVQSPSTADRSLLSDQANEATPSGKKNHLKHKASKSPQNSPIVSDVSPQAKPVGQENKTPKGKALKPSDFLKKDNAISTPNLNVVEAKEEPAIRKSSRKRISLPQFKLDDSEKVSKQILLSPLAAEGEVSCNDEPSPAKKKKLVGEPELTGQLDQASIVDEKPVESSEKTSRNGKAKAVAVERKDVSKDSRLQDVQQAAEAVLTLAEKKFQVRSKKQLFAEDAQPVFLQIHTFRVPKTPPRALRFNLPHSIHEKNADICLILADPIKGRKRDTEQDAIVENYKEMLENKGVKNIKEVIPFNYLRAQYSQYEMKRRFAALYDIYLCDSRFVGHATHFLGKHFFNEKVITPIRVVKKGEREFIDDLKSAIDFSLHKTWMRVHPRGTSFNVVVGNTKLTSEQIAANTLRVLNDLQVCFPGGLDNIKMAVLKGHESLPAPVFVSLKPHNEVPVPVVRSINSRHGEPATGELTTSLGREITVFPSGRIDIRKKMTEEDLEYVKIMRGKPKRKDHGNLEAKSDEKGTDKEEEDTVKDEDGLEDLMKDEDGLEDLMKDEDGLEDLMKDEDGLEDLMKDEEGSEDAMEGSENEEEKPDVKDFSQQRYFDLKDKKPSQKKKFDAKKKFDPKKKFSQEKKFSPGKKSSPGKKFSPGKKSAPGKKFSLPKKTNSGKQPVHEKRSTGPKKGKKASQKS